MWGLLNPSKERRVFVNEQEALVLLDYFDDDHYIQSVYELFLKYIFTTGFEISLSGKKEEEEDDDESEDEKKDEGEIDESEDENEDEIKNKRSRASSKRKEKPKKRSRAGATTALKYLIRQYWNEFGKNALRYFLALGYTAYQRVEIFDEVLGRKIIVPRHLERSMYEVEVMTRSGSLLGYNIYLKNRAGRNFLMVQRESPERNVRFFVVDGRGPDPVRGDHRSLLAPLSSLAMRKSLREQLFDIALEQAANPPVTIAYEPDPSGALVKPTLNLPSTSIIPSGMTSTSAASLIAHMSAPISANGGNNSSVGTPIGPATELTESVNVYRINTNETSSMLDKRMGRCQFVQNVVRNVHLLDKGFTLTSKQPETGQTQERVAEEEEIYGRAVFTLFQVPVGLFNPTTAPGAKTTTHIDDEELRKLNKTLRDHSDLLERFVTFAFSVVQGVEYSRLHVTLVPTPNVTVTQVFNFISQNVISEKTGKQILLDITGIAKNKIFFGKNTNDRPPVGGSENMADQMMGAKKRVILAEAKEREAKAEMTKKEAELETLRFEHEKEILNLKMEFEKRKTENQIKILDKKAEVGPLVASSSSS